jgi:hypothetical protein
MDIQNLDSSEQEVAVRLFREGLKPIATDLIEAIDVYQEAETAFKKAEARRNDIAADYRRVLSLIKKAGGQVHEKEASLANFEIDNARQQASAEAQEQPSKSSEPQGLDKTETKPPLVIRNEVVEALRASKKFQTANDLVTLTRKRLGLQIPDSTITSGLSIQWRAGKVLRFQSPNRTNVYGVPEWFLEGKPKQEYFDNQQMSIEN